MLRIIVIHHQHFLLIKLSSLLKMATKFFMKRLDESNATNAYEPYEYREYREGRVCDKNFMCVTDIRKPFLNANAFSLIHDLPGEIYPRHLQELYARFYFDHTSLSFNFSMYGHGYSWNLRKLGKVLDVGSSGNMFYTRSTNTKDFMNIKFYHPNTYATEAPIHPVLIQNTILEPDYHCEDVPFEHWSKFQLHHKVLPWADVLLKNVFVELEAQEKLPIVVGYMLYCIMTETPFNFAYFIAKRMEGLGDNNEPLPYARLLSRIFNFIKDKYPHDTSRMMEVDDVSPMEDGFTMDSLVI